ncbi:xanthine dehydrogenase/oxidase-like isoform X1 [Trichogramma pretiosum]|uniref:xanthine dehydrogenase/oxidase-like isoform X1 n=1 Tax=Trichogramma pretiosum TaxID=7493 RepID=UPI000C71C97E|nr:xanthine dehydrogenase/oxidase-like isoform X1 [Trichogramma pretiosum]
MNAALCINYFCNVYSEVSSVYNESNSVQFTINDISYEVPKFLPVDTKLNSFIRDVAELKGTKAMCLEGGCGSCIVTVSIKNSNIISVNSCLIPVIMCDGWKITTIEGLGGKKTGYHTLQATLAEMNGSQCGFCSAGWVMNMYSLMQNGKITMKEVENSFAGNICRCTGYRPILDAFKSFASDAPPQASRQIQDIEDMYKVHSCGSCSKKLCKGNCKNIEIVHKSSFARTLKLTLNESRVFHKVLEVNEIFNIFEEHPNASYIINGGNTAHGVYRTKKVEVYIDINDVQDLHKIVKEDKVLTLGANVTISVAKSTFEKFMSEKGFSYLKQMSEHIDLVATVPIRNIGTIAGNLIIKSQHPEFPSDLFLIFETAGAKVHVLNTPASKTIMSLMDFLPLEMKKKLIYSIEFPAMSDEYCYKTYKIMPRAQNSHAIINAGFLFKLDKTGKILEKPNMIFGGVNPDFLHALKTETFLVGKDLFNNGDLKEALKILYSELEPDHVLPDPKPEYRKLLATCLFYKFVLNSSPKVSSRFQSGSTMLSRELSSGKQEFDTDRNTWPLNEPITKVEAIHQTSGEAEYLNDIAIKHDEVFCAFTLADSLGEIEIIDSDEAMNIDGVVAFYCAKDIPGKNAFLIGQNQYTVIFEDEVVFAEKEVVYVGQPYGLIVAETQAIALHAASLVKIVYSSGPKRKPILTVRDVLDRNDQTRINRIRQIPAKKPAGDNIKYEIKGSYECGSQYHFSMETQTCVCVPVEDGMDIYSSTQWMDLVQSSVAKVLNVPMNSLNLRTRRLGGSYGAKISRAAMTACACALACHKLNRPARLVMTIEDNMRAVGKRTPCLMNYDLAVDENGKIQQMDLTYYGNQGSSFNETYAIFLTGHVYNCYDPSTWTWTMNDVKTDLASNTWCRAPGSTEGTATIEHIMERIARVTKKDPLEVRMANMNEDDKASLIPMIEELKKTSNYDERLFNVNKYNTDNRWKKKGISLVPMKFPLLVFGLQHALVSIYARDGTVSVSTAGIEMGQGLHTKLAQIAAYTLGIDMKMVSVKPSINWTSPNSYLTGSSITSDTAGYATLRACKILLERLKPIKDMLGGNPSWQELVMTAHHKSVDMCASFMFNGNQDEVKTYPVYGVAVSEVEIDVLTGQHLIHRVDILADSGTSLNPKVDIGQVEGGFVMGIGYWTSEELIYDPNTGALTNYRTWNYKVPGAKDIPVDFRVSLRRNAPNPLGVLGSKTTGEPPMCLSCSIPIAIRQAINSARLDAGNTDIWYQLDNGLTTEKIFMSCMTNVQHLEL